MGMKRKKFGVALVSIVLLVGGIAGCDGLFADLDEASLNAENQNQGTGEVSVSTIAVEDVTDTAATFRGEIFDLSDQTVADHGFCWSAQSDLSEECEFLGEVNVAGSFSHRVDELTRGQGYSVRAVVVVAEERDYGDELDFSTEAPSVTGVEAGQGVDEEGVEISWDEMPDAEGYRLYRDGEQVIELGMETSYLDDEPESGELIAPQEVTASQGDFGEYVEVRWEPVDEGDLDGAQHHYAVRAIYADVESELSDEVPGLVEGVEVAHYEIEVNGESWLQVEDEELFRDEEAPLAELEIGEPSASQGDFLDFVRVQLELYSAYTEVQYRVRAVSVDDEPGPVSDEATGWRGLGELTIQLRRAGNENSSFDVIATEEIEAGDFDEEETVISYDDSGAPVDGTEKLYQFEMISGDESEILAEGITGFRADRFVYAIDGTGRVQIHDSEGGHVWSDSVGSGGQKFNLHVAVDVAGYFYAGFVEDYEDSIKWGVQQWQRDDQEEGFFNEGATFEDPSSGYIALTELKSVGEQLLIALLGTVFVDSAGPEEVDSDVYNLYFDDSAIENDEAMVHGGEFEDWHAIAVEFDSEGTYLAGNIIDPDWTGMTGGHVQGQHASTAEVWSKDYDAELFALAADFQGGLFVAECSDVHKLDIPESGDEPENAWSYSGHDSFVASLAVDDEGNVYTASWDNTVRKISGDDGEEVWIFEGDTDGVNSVVVDEWGNAYVAGASTSGDEGRLMRIDEDGEEVWSENFEAPVHDVVVDRAP